MCMAVFLAHELKISFTKKKSTSKGSKSKREIEVHVQFELMN